MTLVLLGTVVLLCLLPAITFLGGWYVLCRMQRSSLVAKTCNRAGTDDPAVSWSDVIDAYRDPQQSLFALPNRGHESDPAVDPGADACPGCAAENESFASFCHNCSHPL